MGFDLIYLTYICGNYLLKVSLWKRVERYVVFPGGYGRKRGNIAQADVARLGSIGLTLSPRHLFKDKIVRYVKKEYIIGSIQVKDVFRNMNLGQNLILKWVAW